MEAIRYLFVMICVGMSFNGFAQYQPESIVYINQKVPHISIEKYTTYQQERIASVHKK
jgi:hypothetical protein